MLGSCLVPRLVVGEPHMTQLMDGIANQVLEAVVANVRCVDQRREAHSHLHAAEGLFVNDTSGVANPLERQLIEPSAERFEDTLNAGLDTTLG